MPTVSNLAIKLQTGSDNTYYATWKFQSTSNTNTTTTTNTAITAGSLVSISSGATYYNGVAIPSWVLNERWYVVQVSGDRAVLGKNASGSHDIQSPINTKYLSGGTTSSSTTSTTTVADNTLDHYTVSWYYDTGNGVWFSGSSSDTKDKNSTYSPPSNTRRIRVVVLPVAKTHKVNDEEVVYWTGTSKSQTYNVSYDPPTKAATPDIEIKKYVVTVKVENISDAKADQVQFEIYKGLSKCKTGTVTVKTRMASFSCGVSPGGEYRVRCRYINLVGSSKYYGEWSDYSSTAKTIPATPYSITKLQAKSETSIYIEWTKTVTAETYELEYTTKKEYFNGSDQTSTITGIEFNHYEKTGLESGKEYFFRVRAVNQQGNSSWSGIKSIVIGKKPSAPTTWSSSTTVSVGEELVLYWVHNSEDGSKEKYAELEITCDGKTETGIIKNPNFDSDEPDKASKYVVKTELYREGVSFEWRVRTAGITNTLGEWSVMRKVDIYAPPTLSMRITDVEGNEFDTLTTFPFYIYGLAGPNTQAPIGYHVTIAANESYETRDGTGRLKRVNVDEQVYSKYFDITSELLVEMSAGNIDLQDNISYTITCTVAMNSGLTAEVTDTFYVDWSESSFEPSAEIGIDKDTVSAYIHPYCVDAEGNLVGGITLAVYRKEFDGTFTTIAEGLKNGENIYVIDPHPALDYARYRIVAITAHTGAVGYFDVPAYPVKEKSIVIQWDDEWSNFYDSNGDENETPPWSGSMLRLPYNIDVTDKYEPDVVLVEYVGRKHPVSYFGTHLGESATWKVSIDREDRETLYALRRLAVWMDNVYVREPSGSGYWAKIKVSFSQTHNELTIPVTLDIVRVEGGE